MKTKLHKFILLSLGLYLLFFLSAVDVFAKRESDMEDYSSSIARSATQSVPQPQPSPPPPSNNTPEPKPTPSSIPDTFDVTQLSVEGQKLFLPKKGDKEQEITGVTGFLVNAIALLVKLIGSVALIVFIIGALLTVTSEGKEDRLEKGKTAMLYAIIGLLIAFFSFIIVTFVQSILF